MCNGAGPKKITEWFNNSCFETAALAQALANRTPRFGDSGTQYPEYSRSAKLGYAFIKKANISSGTTGNSGGEFFNAFNHTNLGIPGTSSAPAR
jgi:hypothetical protein